MKMATDRGGTSQKKSSSSQAEPECSVKICGSSRAELKYIVENFGSSQAELQKHQLEPKRAMIIFRKTRLNIF